MASPSLKRTPSPCVDIESLHNSFFDYIICGGGTAGCLLASRLVTLPNTTVLLVEAGRDSGLAPDVLVPGKYVHQLSADPEGLWQLPTVPQKQLNGRELTFLRGRQMGGSSAINYMALARGPEADYDTWAEIVGDDAWKWENVLPLMRELEDFRPHVPSPYEAFAKPISSNHGTGGPLSVGFGDVIVPGVDTFFEACIESGMGICPDNNGGNPVGVGLAQFNVGNGQRSYAANAYLNDDARKVLKGLTILTDTLCERVRFQGRRAMGVDLSHDGTQTQISVQCRREIILTAGTFGSPQILMLSGIGPEDVLARHNIPMVMISPGCGQNMLDHSILSVEYRIDSRIPAHNQVFANPALLADAESQYAKDRTGPLSIFGTSGAVAFPKIERLYSSKEFGDLDSSTRAFLLEESRPSAEIWLGSGPSAYSGVLKPEECYMTLELLMQNNLSRGSVTLSSTNPRNFPTIDPKFLEHPFDQRIAIETVREAIRVGSMNAYKNIIEEMVHGPTSLDDESILDFVRANLGQGYHSMGTCKMGQLEDKMSVVDAEFRVIGVDGLRVADLSVCPILTCNHTQINAYLIGEKCARAVMKDA